MNSLIVFVKNPIVGTVKTRLAKTIGEEKATDFYKELLKYTKLLLVPIKNLHKSIYYADFVNEDDLWNDFEKYQQAGQDLGERMKLAFEEQFALGANKVIIIGSDCFEIQEKHIFNAIEGLNDNDVVFGPATDGGYYLLGMKQIQDCIFDNKPWSTDQLLQVTLNELAQKEISYQLLEILSDVDDFEDYKKYTKKSKK